MLTRLISCAVISLFLATTLLSGCTTAPTTRMDRNTLHQNAQAAIATFKASDPTMNERFDDALAYAIFPTVGKGAVGVGGAYGRGELYENGTRVGYCDLTQGSIGFQLGGQAYSEVVFFQTRGALNNFKSGNLNFAAQASAVAATAGASADASYRKGVVVFTVAKGGLMYEASIGGQRFTFVPASR